MVRSMASAIPKANTCWKAELENRAKQDKPTFPQDIIFRFETFQKPRATGPTLLMADVPSRRP